MTRRPIDGGGWPFPTRPPAERAGWLSTPCWRDPAGPLPASLDTYRRPGGAPRPAAPAPQPAPSGDLFEEE